jgi:hypothetical protein
MAPNWMGTIFTGVNKVQVKEIQALKPTDIPVQRSDNCTMKIETVADLARALESRACGTFP